MIKLLERHFEIALETPDGINKIRELILSLAMQGKLVPQDPKDEPASELIKEIEAEKKKLIKEGKMRSQKLLASIAPEEIPYELPNGWEWVRLNTIAEYNGRDNVGPKEISPETWVLDLEDIEKTTSKILRRAVYSDRQSKSTKSVFYRGDVLYGKLRPYLDKVVVADKDGVCTTEIVPIVPSQGIDAHYLRWLLKRPSFIKHVNELSYGVKMPRLGTMDALKSIHPLPPITEQKRIVAKIDELMALCDKLEEERKARDSKRIKINTAAVNQLVSAADKSDFNKSWKFIERNFDDIYSVRENVDELKKAILQLAVMGKLVPQNSTDEPASELIKKIEAEKNKLIKEGKMRSQKPLAPIAPEEMPYELPEGWEWIRLPETYLSIGSKFNQLQTKDYGEFGDIPIIDQGKSFIAGYSNLKEKILHIDDPVIVFGDHTKHIKYIDFNFIIGADGVKVLCPYSLIYSRFFYFVLKSFDLTDRGYARHFKVLNEKLFPVPPLNEQKCIVAKIDELIALCDKLDQYLQDSSDKQERILNAVLAKV